MYNKCMHYTTPYEAPTLTVDLVAFQIIDDALTVLLMQRPNEPFKDAWALPGGYTPKGETTLSSLHRVLLQKTGVDLERDLRYVSQLYTFDTVARDPRGHAVSVTYMGAGMNIEPKGGSARIQFCPADTLPVLAYDHKKIISFAITTLRETVIKPEVAAAFVPETFTLSQLQTVHEAILSQPIDKRNFRKRILGMNVLKETGDFFKDGAHRPAKLYRFRT